MSKFSARFDEQVYLPMLKFSTMPPGIANVRSFPCTVRSWWLHRQVKFTGNVHPCRSATFKCPRSRSCRCLHLHTLLSSGSSWGLLHQLPFLTSMAQTGNRSLQRWPVNLTASASSKSCGRVAHYKLDA